MNKFLTFFGIAGRRASDTKKPVPIRFGDGHRQGMAGPE
jgi:hypothetical protein